MAETDAQDTGDDAGDRRQAGAAAPYRVLQLTDLHLFGAPGQRLLEQDTRHTLESVLALAKRQHWPPDAIVLTGDLVHDAQPAGYRFLRKRLQSLQVPYFGLPGNHDRLDLCVGHLDAGAASALRIERAGAWDLLLLDSTVPGSEGGHLSETVLAGLAELGNAGGSRPVLVFLHHHLQPVGSRWIDTMQVSNGAAALSQLQRNPRVRAAVCGHVHQAAEQLCHGVRLLATPSTCVQFLPRSDDFALDPRTPGYRWLDLHRSGHLDTGVERTDAYPEPLRFTSSGY